MLHDASAGTLPEDEAAEWIEGWIALCRDELGVDGFRLIFQCEESSPQRRKGRKGNQKIVDGTDNVGRTLTPNSPSRRLPLLPSFASLR